MTIDKPLYSDSPVLQAPVERMPQSLEITRIGERLARDFYMGTEGWADPTWCGSIYSSQSSPMLLYRNGLSAYARHPLLKTVAIMPRKEPYRASALLGMSAQVPEDFKFIYYPPKTILDPMQRDRYGRARAENSAFLQADGFWETCVAPAREGLGNKLGPVVLSLGAFPVQKVRTLEQRIAHIEAFCAFLDKLRSDNVEGHLLAVEIANPSLLTPRLIQGLRALNVRPVICLHTRLPGIIRQIRALAYWENACDETSDWELSGPCLIRWTQTSGLADVPRRQLGHDVVLNDPVTCAAIASLMQKAAREKQTAYLWVGNRAEGNAPMTIRHVAQAIVRRREREYLPARER